MKFKVRDLVRIRKRTADGEKVFDAVVTSIERIIADPGGEVEFFFGYEPVDPSFGFSGASRIPCRGPYGTLAVDVLASGQPLLSERINGTKGRRAGRWALIST